MFIADALSTGSLFSLTILELITGVVFIVGFMLSLWKVYYSFTKELHASLAAYGETVQTSLITFETKVVNQIREEIKMSIAILENRQELRIAIAEDKIHTHNDELKDLRDVSYKVKLMEVDLAGLKERVTALEKSY
jgi:hypothetical protein